MEEGTMQGKLCNHKYVLVVHWLAVCAYGVTKP